MTLNIQKNRTIEIGANYSVPCTGMKFCDRAFCVAGPVVWNSLGQLVVAVHDADHNAFF